MSSSDNLTEVTRAIEELIIGISLTKDHLGVDMLDIVTNDVEQTSGRQQAPDGDLWRANEPKYAASKGYRPVGVKSGLMLNRRELVGTRDVRPDEATIEYGTDQEAREHAAGFEAGGRKLWGLSLDAERAMVRRTEDFLEKHLASLNAR